MIGRIKTFYSVGTPVQIVVRIALSLVILYLISRVLKSGMNVFSNFFKNLRNESDISDIIEAAVPEDGSTIDQPSFLPTARMIADGQYQAMAGIGTDERNLVEPLKELSGAQLQLVFQEFGSKEGKTLFQWYKEELCPGFPNLCAFISNIFHHPSSEGCGTYLDQCSELEFMEGIWKKSGLPF